MGCHQDLEDQKRREEPHSPGHGVDKAGGLTSPVASPAPKSTPIRSGPHKKQRFGDEEYSPPKPKALFSEPFPKDPVLEVRVFKKVPECFILISAKMNTYIFLFKYVVGPGLLLRCHLQSAGTLFL